jgi:hypothetical protein
LQGEALARASAWGVLLDITLAQLQLQEQFGPDVLMPFE